MIPNFLSSLWVQRYCKRASFSFKRSKQSDTAFTGGTRRIYAPKSNFKRRGYKIIG